MGFPPGAFVALYGGIIGFIILMVLVILGSFAILLGMPRLWKVVKYTGYLLVAGLLLSFIMVIL